METIQAIFTSPLALTLNGILTCLLAILTAFYYRRFLPSLKLSHLRYLTFDNRYVDIRVTLSNKSYSAEYIQDVYLQLPDGKRLYPLPIDVAKNIKVSDAPTLPLNLNELISYLNDDTFIVSVRNGNMMETPFFIQPATILPARFIFDSAHVCRENITSACIVFRLSYCRKKRFPIFQPTKE